MRIARIRWAPFRIPFVAPYETALGRSTHRGGVIVVLETESGYEGLGEGSLDPAAPEEEGPAIFSRVEALARELITAQLDEVDNVLEPYSSGDEASRAAHCAIETALADAGAREAGRSVAALLSAGSPVRDRVPVNATIAARSTTDASAAALLARASGYGCVKLKVGMEPNIEAEAERVGTIREVIGDDVKLRLDANGAWDEGTAIAAIRAFEPFDIELIEQPVPAHDLAALGRVRQAVNTAVAADEAVTDYASAEAVLDHADVLVVKPVRLGGPSVAHYLARFAAAAGLGVVVTTTIDTGIATAMALHIAAALPDDARAHGLATASLLESDLLAGPLPIERGYMSLLQGPGLGVTLDEDGAAGYLGEWRELRA